jgi:hypothetical protein
VETITNAVRCKDLGFGMLAHLIGKLKSGLDSSTQPSDLHWGLYEERTLFQLSKLTSMFTFACRGAAGLVQCPWRH